MSYERIQPTETHTGIAPEHLTCSAYLLCLDEDLNNPILSLEPSSRVAFLLHHLFGYKIENAASPAAVSEQEFRASLRSAYLQLASSEVGPQVHVSEILNEPVVA